MRFLDIGASAGIAILSNHISAPSFGMMYSTVDAIVGFRGTVARLQNVARPADGQADVAIGKRVDVFRRVELLDIGADRFQQLLGLFDVDS
jgi:hypothetical protein